MSITPEDVLGRFQADLDRELEAVLGSSDLPLYRMMRYHLGWVNDQGRRQRGAVGKRVRPALCLLACQGVGGDWHQALPAAAAVELVHDFSLIHDDIEDSSPRRRGRATVWQVWGQSQAINVGDAMHTLSRLAVLRLEERGVEPQKVLRAAYLLDDACLKLCQGQYLDLDYEGRERVTVEEYLEMIRLKTAALFRASLMAGALVGTGDEEAIERLGEFGEALGLAFQVQDDILGIWGQERNSGKLASDLGSRKKTLPVIHALEQSEEMRRLYTRGALDESGVARALAILDDVGAREYAWQFARRFRAQALERLEAARIATPTADELRSIASFLVERSR